jgi:hypothetical protein
MQKPKYKYFIPYPLSGEMVMDEISKLRKEIEESAEKIKRYNPENISLLRKEDYKNATDEAIRLIKEYDINLYYSYLGHDPPSVFDVLSSKNLDEFIRNLEVYASDMESWAEREEDSFYDSEVSRYIKGNVSKIEDVDYIVKVYYIDPAWGMGQLGAVILCKDKKEAEKVANKIWSTRGAYGIPGANINTKIEEVTPDTTSEIITEYGNDLIKYSRQYHHIRDLEILGADEILD